MDKPGTDPRGDEELVRAFQNGDQAAFDRLLMKHQDRVFNLSYRILGDYTEADDCAQVAFIKAWRALKSFRGGSAFSTWIYRIALNVCLSRLRSSGFRLRKKTLSLAGGGDPAENEAGIEIKDEAFSPDRQAERHERERLIQSAIDSLPEDQKTVVVLRDMEGLSYEEVAAISGLPLGTVKSKLSRAREELRGKLKPVLEDALP